ncbi:MAG TPA: hypothetical protein PLL09_06145 [Flavobacterium sp.]|uniref:hypothetical protein n=1 Tax=unclassified Flavobacterium TaxID=196869 RepID=UPI0025BFA93F|nr:MULTISPECIES: hypothetical protein [unclassified Flavobacterium]HRE77387.1 hypothetical protein [Flavobacterium sp.]
MEIDKAFHCQFCSLKKYDFKIGTTCGLTKKVPDFNKTCPDIKFKNQTLESQIIKINADFEHNKDSKFWVILNLIFFSLVFFLLILSGFLFAEYLDSLDFASSRIRLYVIPIVFFGISFLVLKIAVGPFNTYRRDNKIYGFEKKRIDSFLSKYGISYTLNFKRNKRIGESLDIEYDFELTK